MVLLSYQPLILSHQEIQEDQIYVVDLNRGHRGFGFSIRGGQEFNNMPLFVLRIAEGGAADVDKRLRVRHTWCCVTLGINFAPAIKMIYDLSIASVHLCNCKNPLNATT